MSSTPGDTIEVRDNGPFVIPHTEIKHALTIRAGSGFRPVITSQSQDPADGESVMLLANAPLRLEGLDLHCASDAQSILTASRPIYVANCQFLMARLMTDCIQTPMRQRRL